MTITELKNQLARKFRGASLDDIQGVSDFTVFGEAASNTLSHIDPYETVRMHRFDHFSGVYDYSPPSDLKGKKLIDPRPQDGRSGESFTQTFTKEFDQDKAFRYGKISVEMIDGSKVLRLSEGGKASATVDETNAVGTWAAAGGASGLVLDTIIRLDGSDTLRVALDVTGGYIENTTLTSVDLTDFEDIGSFFRKIYLPTATGLTSVTLRIGSTSGDYWLITGEPHFGSYKAGVNLVRFDWADATETGSPSVTAIDYERLAFVTTAAISGVRAGPLSVKLPTPYETPYYANRLFQNSLGTWIVTPTNDNDVIVLEKEAENIFFYECCEIIAEDLSLDTEAVKFRKRLGKSETGELTGAGLYGDYMRDKPTETLRPQTRYIDLPSRRNRRGPRIW